VKLASSVLGGGGGGKADIAQGGGLDLSQIESAIAAIKNALSE
jgi:alanyl-tRNA synthetase